MNLDQRLEQHLHASAAGIDLHAAGAARVITRGRRARRRTMIARTGAGMAVALVAGTAVVRTMDDDGQLVTTDGQLATADSQPGTGDDPTVPAQPAAFGELTWRAVAPSSAIGWSGLNATTGDGTLYALSTEPGKVEVEVGPRPALYRSADGVEWDVVTIGNGPTTINAMTASGDRLYIAGTAPATTGNERLDRIGLPTVATSTDGGVTFTERTLPLDLGPALPYTTAASTMVSGIVVNGDTTVVAVSTFLQLDPLSLLGPETDLSWGWWVTGDGLTVGAPVDQSVIDAAAGTYCEGAIVVSEALNELGGHLSCSGNAEAGIDGYALDPNAIRSSTGTVWTWADLGLGPDVAALVQPAAKVFVATGDGAFEPVATPEFWNAPNSSLQLFEGPTGFVASLSTWGDGVVAADLSLWSSTDGRTWEALATPGNPMWIQQIGVVGDRIVVVNQEPTGWTAHSSTDGSNWTSVDLGAVADPANPTRAVNGYVEAVTVGDGWLVVAVAAPTGAEPVTEDAVAMDHLLLTSTDALDWTVTDLSTLTDARIATVQNLHVSQGRIIVGLALGTRNRPDGLQDRITLVGERP